MVHNSQLAVVVSRTSTEEDSKLNFESQTASITQTPLPQRKRPSQQILSLDEASQTPRVSPATNAIESLTTAVQMVWCMEQMQRLALQAVDSDLDHESNPWLSKYPAEALLSCVSLYCKTAEECVLADTTLVSLCAKTKHFFHLLKFLIRICPDVNVADSDGSNVLHYLLRPLLTTPKATESIAIEVSPYALRTPLLLVCSTAWCQCR